MKNYKNVIKTRYDQIKYDDKGIKRNIYSFINPIGFYGDFKAMQVLSDFVIRVNSCGVPLDKIKICDCGCGGGSKTRILAELTEHPELIYGVDYSKNSIKHCMDMNDLIHYEYADLTVEGGGIPFDDKFDGITSFVVFMHFGTENEIMGALNNIYSALKEKGLFLWYECNAKNHWDGKKKNVDGWGFSEAEMDKYASAAGFKLKKKYGVCSILPILNKSTVYMAKNIWNIWMLELLERLPFEKKYNVRIYSK